jgi:hypothetical protein
MAEAIAEADAEGVTEEYVDMGNAMNTGAPTGVVNDISLRRGLHGGVTGSSLPLDPDQQETTRAQILRGKQAMTMGHQAEDGRSRLGESEGKRRTEIDEARGAEIPSCLGSRRTRPATSTYTNDKAVLAPKSSGYGHATSTSGEPERAETPRGLLSAAQAGKSKGTFYQSTMASICDESKKSVCVQTVEGRKARQL